MKLREHYERMKPSLVFVFLGTDNDREYDELSELYWTLQMISQTSGVILIDTQVNNRWNKRLDWKVLNCRGNVSFMTTCPGIERIMYDVTGPLANEREGVGARLRAPPRAGSAVRGLSARRAAATRPPRPSGSCDRVCRRRLSLWLFFSFTF